MFITSGEFRQFRRTQHAKAQGREVYRGWKKRICWEFEGYRAPPHSQVFGVDLDLLMMHPMNAGLSTPIFFRKCMEVLFAEGHKTEGIFRISGSRESMDEIRRQWDSCVVTDNLAKCDINDVAGILKEFIRELPAPLCQYNLFKNLEISKCTNSNQFVTDVRNLIFTQLSIINREILEELLLLFEHIAKTSIVTLMPTQNISVCWAITIFQWKPHGLTTSISADIEQITS